jgi:hypothetical protein
VSPRLHDLTGKRYGRLLVLGVHPERARVGKARQPAALWLCVCVCGEERLVLGSNLRRGTSQSCGCLAREKTIERSTKHGHARRGNVSKIYTCWSMMKQRCFNPNNKGYRYYGGREDGPITVCKQWRGREDFPNFFADRGDPPEGKSLDRINNNDHYRPGNVRWATASEQICNQRHPKRKARPAKLADIRAYAAALARATSAPGGKRAAP